MSNGEERAEYINVGQECPIVNCEETIGEEHWVAYPRGYAAYHTHKESIAKTWQERGGMRVVPEI